MDAIAYDADALCAMRREANAASLEHARNHMTGIDLLGVELQAECLPAKEAFVRVVVASRERGHPDAVLGAVAGALAWWMIDHVLLNVADQKTALDTAILNLTRAMRGLAGDVGGSRVYSVPGIPAGRA